MTLTEFSYYSRRVLPVGIIFFLVFLVLFYAGKVFLLYLEAKRPQKIDVNAVFGNIKNPTVSNSVSSGQFDYFLDTVEGKPIEATGSAKVFFIPPQTSKFGFREKIYVIAKQFGFDESIKHTLSDTTAKFDDGKQSLTIDITNFNFTYEYDIQKDEGIFINYNIPSKEKAEETAVDFLRGTGRYPEELSKGKTNTLYYKYDPAQSRLQPAARPQEANVVEVDFYRPDVEALPQALSMVSPSYFTSQNYVIMVFNEEGFKVLKAQVKFFEKSGEQVGVYPIITGEAAYKKLQEGQGKVVSPPKGKNVAVKKMFLGYYDPDTYQEYLQPVFVFLGDDNFVGYVPAVQSEYVNK